MLFSSVNGPVDVEEEYKDVIVNEKRNLWPPQCLRLSIWLWLAYLSDKANIDRTFDIKTWIILRRPLSRFK